MPAEVLTLHALIISATSESEKQGTDLVSKLPSDDLATLCLAFWGLLVLSALLYWIPKRLAGTWNRLDCIRICIGPLAFVGWTMLQPTTLFDAAFAHVGQTQRTVIALFLGAILSVITLALASVADKRTPLPASPDGAAGVAPPPTPMPPQGHT